MPTSQEAEDDLLTLEEVACLLDAPQSFVAQLVARDAVPYERPPKGIEKFKADELRFRRDEIEAWLKSGTSKVDLGSKHDSHRVVG